MTASATSRFVASLIDGLIWAVPIGLITVVYDPPVLPFMVIATILWTAYEVLGTTYCGCTIGKFVCGIRAVNREGRYPNLQQSVIRYWVKTLEPISTVSTVLTNAVGNLLFFALSVYQIALFVSIVRSPLHQGWHDRLADTYVVYKQNVGTAVVVTEVSTDASSPEVVDS